MKSLIAILSCTFLLGPATAAEDGDLPKLIRVYVEYIDAPHELVTAVMQSGEADSGPKLHAHMRALVKEKKARLMETNIITTRSGQKATLESIQEYMYAVEPDPEDFRFKYAKSQLDPASDLIFRPPLRPATPTSFATRNIGVTLEIEPHVTEQDEVIDLHFAPEIDDLLALETWMEHVDQWGDASVRMPLFEALRIDTGIVLQRGRFGFVGLLTPTKRDGGLEFERKIMLFVKADVLTPEAPDTPEQ